MSVDLLITRLKKNGEQYSGMGEKPPQRFLMAYVLFLRGDDGNFHVFKTILCFFLLQLVACELDVHGSRMSSPKRVQDLNADFIIGGSFPVFLNEKNATKCNGNDKRFQLFKSVHGETVNCYRMNLFGLMWVEAMLFAIEEINNNSKILPNVTLGYDIRDSANEVQFAMSNALDFSTNREEMYRIDVNTNRSCSNASIVAVIGGAGSKISKAAAYVLGVNSIPQISYSSTSPSLSNKANFPSFLRTIPPDYIQAQVMADLVSYFNWNYVSTIATDEDYGRLGIEAFKREIKTRNVCISIDELFHPDYTLPDTKAQMSSIVSALKADKLAKVVVLFCEIPNALALLEEAERQGMEGKIWIGTDSWGDKNSILSFRDSLVGGMLGVVPSKGNIMRFEEHMAQLTPANTEHNPWFRDYWHGTYRCRKEIIAHLKDGFNTSEEDQQNSSLHRVKCDEFSNGKELPTAAKLELNKAANVMDAVYSVALALDKIIRCKKGHGLLTNGSCPSITNGVEASDVLTYIKNISFTGKLGFPIVFDKYGDIKGNYLVKSLQPDPDSAQGKKFITLGTWEWATRKLHFHNITNITWNGWNPRVPFSRCSSTCEPGHYKVQGDSICCWKCVQCPFGSITNREAQSQCNICPLGFTSSENHTRCLQLPEVYLEWHSTTGSVILALSGLGFLSTIFTLGVFHRYRNSAIVKASTREYSQLILLMIAGIFLLPLLHVGRATDVICKARPFCFAFVINFWASLMLTKTRRLLLIFKNKMLPGKFGYGIRLQLLFAVLLTLPIMLGIIPWVWSFPPEVTVYYYDTRICVDCGEMARKLLMIVLGYTAVLAIPSTYLAYRARNLPANFNETRLIGFTMFTVCVIWIVFVPCYFDSSAESKNVVFCFALISTGFAILFCTFSVRLRIIFFQPEKNKTELVRASMFDYTMRARSGSFAARNLRRMSVVTVGTFSVPTKAH